jgi:hypothetical protein
MSCTPASPQATAWQNENSSVRLVDALVLQDARGLDAFPGRGDLDEHTLAADAGGFVQPDQAVRTRHIGRSIKAQAGIDFGRDTARYHLQDLPPEAHQHLIHHFVQRQPAVGSDRLGQQRRVVGLLHGLEDERRIGGRILRRKLGELLEIARVGDDGGELLELVELVHGVGSCRSGSSRFAAIRN